jgi:transposase
MGSTRRAFTEEYKEHSVNLVLRDGRPLIEVARNIGVHQNTLGKWVRKVREEEQEPDEPVGAVLSEDERLELLRLREQAKNDKATIAALQMQVEFAKKVATWFAKDKQ